MNISFSYFCKREVCRLCFRCSAYQREALPFLWKKKESCEVDGCDEKRSKGREGRGASSAESNLLSVPLIEQVCSITLPALLPRVKACPALEGWRVLDENSHLVNLQGWFEPSRLWLGACHACVCVSCTRTPCASLKLYVGFNFCVECAAHQSCVEMDVALISNKSFIDVVIRWCHFNHINNSIHYQIVPNISVNRDNLKLFSS